MLTRPEDKERFTRGTFHINNQSQTPNYSAMVDTVLKGILQDVTKQEVILLARSVLHPNSTDQCKISVRFTAPRRSNSPAGGGPSHDKKGKSLAAHATAMHHLAPISDVDPEPSRQWVSVPKQIYIVSSVEQLRNDLIARMDSDMVEPREDPRVPGVN